MSLPTREEAQALLEEHVKDDYQLHHSKMVALAMESYATEFNEDPNLWYITGLLHDLDYYEFPNEHPGKSLEWFKEWGYPEELIHAVEAHAFNYNGFETEPQNKLAAALIACDELSGLLHAYAIMRPTGYEGMKVKSVKKKLKDKAFAAKINRDDIAYGVEKLGLEMSDHIQKLIATFQENL
ncbi:HD domain-containing protein [Candidatus Dojkabacteria bacterium]|uniref:HD domain-containing protein n=1 Tax=Candidatus Dojkabacteria bacterium TaxID=2099670 RepID=A0A955L914_9BACT|nr:HD domain-containing protein [Candidatus Dojkabacteria bacterium]